MALTVASIVTLGVCGLMYLVVQMIEDITANPLCSCSHKWRKHYTLHPMPCNLCICRAFHPAP